MEEEFVREPPAAKHNREESWQTQFSHLRLALAIGGISLLLIVVSITLIIKSIQTTSPIRFSADSASESSVLGGATNQITVDIQGAVVHPGIYHLSEGSRVEDALTVAGGLTKEADTQRISQTINRAAKVTDGGKLYLPSHNISSPNIPDSPNTPYLISVNAASQSQLEALSGIGPVTATKIINGRPYQTLDELVTRKVLSRSLLEKLKEQVSL